MQVDKKDSKTVTTEARATKTVPKHFQKKLGLKTLSKLSKARKSVTNTTDASTPLKLLNLNKNSPIFTPDLANKPLKTDQRTQRALNKPIFTLSMTPNPTHGGPHFDFMTPNSTKELNEADSRKIYLSGVPRSLDKHGLRNYFETLVGAVEEVNIVSENTIGPFRYAFVTFFERGLAERCLQQEVMVIHGHSVTIKKFKRKKRKALKKREKVKFRDKFSKEYKAERGTERRRPCQPKRRRTETQGGAFSFNTLAVGSRNELEIERTANLRSVAKNGASLTFLGNIGKNSGPLPKDSIDERVEPNKEDKSSNKTSKKINNNNSGNGSGIVSLHQTAILIQNQLAAARQKEEARKDRRAVNLEFEKKGDSSRKAELLEQISELTGVGLFLNRHSGDNLRLNEGGLNPKLASILACREKAGQMMGQSRRALKETAKRSRSRLAAMVHSLCRRKNSCKEKDPKVGLFRQF